MGEGDDNSQSDWLPAGWKMEFKVRKNGKKDKYYIDPSNEHKFQSKPEVLRYLKNVVNNHLLCKESKKGSSTDASPVKFVDKEAVLEGDDNSHLDCLPAGWKMEVKIRKNGRKDRYYVDPSNEHKFQSKPEALRYLKNVENNHPPSEESKKGSSTDGSPANFIDEEVVSEGDDNSPLDWLPDGWKMEVKVRKNGKKDKYYIDPSNEHKYQSKPEVLRYLKKAENNHPVCEESNKGSSTDGSPTKSVDTEAVSEGLPAGWIKKFRVTRSGSRKDPYYIDPVSGQQFVSMEEVFRYLNSKKTVSQKNDRHVSNPEEKSTLKSGAGDHATTPSTAERRKLRSDSNKEVQKPVLENQITKTEASAIDKLGHKLKPCKEKDKSSEIRSPGKKETLKLVKTLKDIPVEKMEIDRPLELQEYIKTEKIQTAERVDMPEDIQTVGSRNKRKIKREIELPRRSSKRLAGVEVELPKVLELPTRVRPAGIKPTGGEDQTVCSTNHNNDSDNSVHQVKRVKTIDNYEARRAVIDALFNEEQGVSNVVLETHPEQGVVTNAVDLEKHRPEQGVANVILEKHPEQGASNIDLEKHPEQGLLTNVILRRQLEQGVADVITPKQQADQEVADVIIPKQQDEQNALPEKQGEQEMDFVSSLGELWNDPCIEFAIKTLTGDLPVVDNDEILAKKSVDAAGPSSCQDLPPGDLWSDPCFEFAVKTLTGDIQPPVDTICIQTNFQKQHWSSKSGANGAYR